MVVIAIGVLIGGVAASSLVLVYLAIGISAAALLVLAAGVVVKKDELFTEEARPSAAFSGQQAAAAASGLAPAADARSGALAGARIPGHAQGTAQPGASAQPGAWPPAESAPAPAMPSSFHRPPAPPTRADPVLPWADSLPTRVDISGNPDVCAGQPGSGASGGIPAGDEAQPWEKAPAASVWERVAPRKERAAPPEEPSTAALAAAAPTSPMPVTRVPEDAALQDSVPAGTEAEGTVPDGPDGEETAPQATLLEGTVPEDTRPEGNMAEETVAFASMPAVEADQSLSPGATAPADGSDLVGSAETVTAGSGAPARPAAVSPGAQVTVVPGVPRYHGADCVLTSIMDEGDVQKMTVAEAEKAGCTPCIACHPDDD
jgi:hypothetical protein